MGTWLLTMRDQVLLQEVFLRQEVPFGDEDRRGVAVAHPNNHHNAATRIIFGHITVVVAHRATTGEDADVEGAIVEAEVVMLVVLVVLVVVPFSHDNDESERVKGSFICI
ncbi:hypothetical protein BCR43DRAFT_119214 [Syncephalastrum racemosum]|uniref:Uncharacterized protein n=1 Tax=Syncephalastrum racemosum TaxID=13706 RepID=A0A1X2GZH7_SYNRA|nr:hypothetical protein BCR43DRAFT_119214 [Syncephalastrum racemosum]